MKTNEPWKSEPSPLKPPSLDFCDEEEAVDLERALRNCRIQDPYELRHLIRRYRNASAHVQWQVRCGKMNLADLDEGSLFPRLRRKKRRSRKADLKNLRDFPFIICPPPETRAQNSLGESAPKDTPKQADETVSKELREG